jgi:glycerol-3-phosphate dehydrogenase (NAD(P)+)
MPQGTTIAVLGAGAWGTALAILLARNGHPTLLWARSAAHVAAMRAAGRNERYLPEIHFPAGLHLTADITEALAEARDILVVVPSEAFRSVLETLVAHRRPTMRLAWATKGLEPGRSRLLHEVVTEVLGAELPAAVLSGPTFAAEVVKCLPTAVTVASHDAEFATWLATCLHSDTFRAYTSDDMAGVELGGAVKNVLAIAAGISDGLGFGANARAALIARGLAEIVRLGVKMGGRRETFMGLAGLGDLVLTCTEDLSRNRRLGLALARGQPLAEAVAAIGQVVEGTRTAREVYRLAQIHEVEMPISEQVYQVLYAHKPPSDAVRTLLLREPKAEWT